MGKILSPQMVMAMVSSLVQTMKVKRQRKIRVRD
jgi:hypothetical protein